MYPELKQYLTNRAEEFDRIPAERRKELESLAANIVDRYVQHRTVQVVFICTHNSRRSHMAQLWAAAAAAYHTVPNVETFSGGTEATAFNPRAIAALVRAGWQIHTDDTSPNPVYRARWGVTAPELSCFSKVYDHPRNPQQGFLAVMVCSQADTSCPQVAGADLRIALPYEDPKIADDTPREAATYDDRCAQIAREMLYLFSQVKSSLHP